MRLQWSEIRARAAEFAERHKLDVRDKLYRACPFGSDRERVEHLFPLYEALVQPTAAAPKANKRTERRVARNAGKETLQK